MLLNSLEGFFFCLFVFVLKVDYKIMSKLALVFAKLLKMRFRYETCKIKFILIPLPL